MTLQPGFELGPYRILEQIGKGGMATVYKAYQPSLSRYVAIKVLPEFYAEEPTFLERFRQEAVAIAQLRHPNILAVYDYGEEKGTTYIAYEYIAGGTLKDQLGASLPPEYAISILRPIASALDYAHARGMLHRDVKPSNILLTLDGTPVLGDFGLAKILEKTSQLTLSGTTVGTPEYMAPEQAVDGEVGPATDVYSLGVVLYEMLVGQLPFTADTPMAVILAHLHNPLPLPRSRNPDLSEGVEAVLLKALAKDPKDRFKSAGELIRSLEAAHSQAPSIPPAAASVPTIAPVSPERAVPSPTTAAAPPSAVAAPRAEAPVPPPQPTPAVVVWKRIPLFLGALGVVLLLVALGGTAVFLRQSRGQPQPEEGGSAPEDLPAQVSSLGVLLRADDFSDPAKGLFLDNQRGTSLATFSDGSSHQFQWEYGYSDKALVGRLKGPYPKNPDRIILLASAEAAGKVLQDFAVEVRAQATKSPEQAAYQLEYVLGQERYGFEVLPREGRYRILHRRGGEELNTLSSGRSNAFNRGREENHLRLEVRGDTLKILANGQEVDWVQQEGLKRRGGTIRLVWKMADSPAEGDVEVRFTDFKVYALEPPP